VRKWYSKLGANIIITMSKLTFSFFVKVWNLPTPSFHVRFADVRESTGRVRTERGPKKEWQSEAQTKCLRAKLELHNLCLKDEKAGRVAVQNNRLEVEVE
jgi:hypothetical protein